MILTPTQLQAHCADFLFQPSTAYGQHYLIAQKPIDAMLKAADVTNNDDVIEVGPGFGQITHDLTQAAKSVTAFEIEKLLQPYWETQQAELANLSITWGNVLHTWDKDAERTPYKVVANIPYQITSPLIQLFLESNTPPTSITLLVQKEVAERICAKPGDMSLLSLSVQYYATPRYVMTVPRGMFWPVPKVDSAVIHIDTIATNTNNAANFFKVAKAGFSHKRKKAVNNISAGLAMDKKQVAQVLADVTGNTDIRPQDIAIAQWKAIATTLMNA